jgi:hypothetical protein
LLLSNPYIHDPAICSQSWLFLLAVLVGCSCWLLFAVIPPPWSQKSDDFRGVRRPFRCFFRHISENSDGLGSGLELR